MTDTSHSMSCSAITAVRTLLCYLSAAVTLCGLCACATPRPEPTPEDSARYAALPYTQRPYNVFGVWYYPIPSSQGFVEQGYASWYGPGFHGKKTSNGESYDMHELTAAHKTLPLGTLVKVTRTDTGKSVVVRLNDRGPFVAGRIIDLSNSAAQALDMIGSGTAPVTIEALQRATERQQDGRRVWTPEPIPDFRTGTFTIPVGDYAASAEAEAVRARLGRDGHDVRILRVETQEGLRFRVCAGTYHDLIEAHISAVHLRDNGYAEACVIALDQSEK
jgi:rare lipoprotein A